jgi:hypothetical protein
VVAPYPALEETIHWLQEGCRAAADHGLAPTICAPETFQELGRSNSTLDGQYQGLACSSAGAQLGVQAPCRPDLPSSSLDRIIALDDLEEFGAEVADVGYQTFAAAEYMEALVQGLTAAGTGALRLNGTGAAVGLLTAANTVASSAAGLFAATYELFRLASVSRSWQAIINQRFDAEDRTRLEGAAAGSSSTGAGTGLALPGGGAPGPGTESPEAASLTQDQPQPVAAPVSATPAGIRADLPADPPAEPVASAATRAQPGFLRDLLSVLWTGSWDPPERDL